MVMITNALPFYGGNLLIDKASQVAKNNNIEIWKIPYEFDGIMTTEIQIAMWHRYMQSNFARGNIDTFLDIDKENKFIVFERT